MAKNTVFNTIRIALYGFYMSGAWRILIGAYVFALVGGMGITLFQNIAAEKVQIAEVRSVALQSENEFENLKTEYEKLKSKLCATRHYLRKFLQSTQRMKRQGTYSKKGLTLL
jgi:hypothetical protein